MDYQEAPISKTVHIRYSSHFRQSCDRYFIASDNAIEKQPIKTTAQRDPAQYPALGGIVLKKLPAGWHGAKPDFYFNGSAKMFIPGNDNTCAIAMLYDVLRPKYRKILQRLLESPAGPVGEKDLQELIGLIPDYANNNKESELISASTKTIDGKQVLVVEEKSIALNRYYYFVYSSDKAVDFENYTQIWFVAPIDALTRYKKEAIESINSLKFI